VQDAGARGVEEHVSLSVLIESVLDDAVTRPCSIGEIIERTGERGFGLLMLVLGLPMLIPFLPPGSSTIVGPIYALFAVQMLTGARTPWLPARFRDRYLSTETVRALRERGLPVIRAAERLSRPRGFWLGERLTLRIIGVVVLLMGIILLSPLPFLNTLPAVAVMTLGMALINRDSVFMLAGVALGGLAVGLVGVSAGVIVAVIARILARLP
jgi:hypothetical protein